MRNEEWIRTGERAQRGDRILLGENADRYDVLDALEVVLGSDPSVDGVEIWVGGEILGHTDRALLGRFLDDDTFTAVTRGLGDGDSASLPGQPKSQAVQVSCPNGDGEYWVTSVDDRDPPRCPRCSAPMAMNR